MDLSFLKSTKNKKEQWLIKGVVFEYAQVDAMERSASGGIYFKLRTTPVKLELLA